MPGSPPERPAEEALSKSQRRLGWSGCLNVRDLGGCPTVDGQQTRWRSVVRADSLGRLTPEGWAALEGYGVRTVIDVRSQYDFVADPYGVPVAVRRIHVPMLDDEDSPTMDAIMAATSTAELYVCIVESCKRQVAALVAAVAEAPPGVVVVHCQVGRDRTGVASALFLALAGATRAAIAGDYAMSEPNLAPLYHQLMGHAGTDEARAALAEESVCRPETMMYVLSHLEARYESAEGYLRACGSEERHLGQLRARLRD